MTENMRNNGGPWGPRLKLVLIGLGLIGGFFLITEHRVHVLPWLPWLILAACPLMHLFMHHGHGDHEHHGGRDGFDGPNTRSRPDSTASPSPRYTGSDSASQHHHGERS